MFGVKTTKFDRHIYESELNDFLPDKIFDCHVHVNKKEFAMYGSHNGGSTWTDLVAEDLTAEDLIQTFKDVLPKKQTKALIFGGCLQDLKQTNDYVLEMGKKYGFPTLFRSSYDMQADWLENEVKNGKFLGLKPYISNCPPYIPPNETRIYDYLPKEHLEVANKNGWIIMLHIPRDKRLKDPVNIAQLLEIDKNYPNIKLIVAHIGRAYAVEDFGNAFTLLKQTKNMMFDFTANLLDDAIEEGIKTVGAERFLFGSDLPIAKMRMRRETENGNYYNVVPKGLYGDISGEPHMRETDEKDITIMFYEQLLAFKRAAVRLKLKDSEVEKTMYSNAANITEQK